MRHQMGCSISSRCQQCRCPFISKLHRSTNNYLSILRQHRSILRLPLILPPIRHQPAIPHIPSPPACPCKEVCNQQEGPCHCHAPWSDSDSERLQLQNLLSGTRLSDYGMKSYASLKCINAKSC